MRKTHCALLIGINYFNTSSELGGCINDINNIKKVLVEKYNYGKIITLTDNKNPKPTRANIIKNLKSVIFGSDKFNELYIHYSGHGTYVHDRNNDEVDGLDEAIVPVDYNASGIIIDDELFDIIKNAKCNVRIVFDSCHSGSCMDLKYSYIYNNSGSLIQTIVENSKETRANICMISGCRDKQLSTDVYNPTTRQNNGALTNGLINFISQSQNRTIKIREILPVLNRNLVEYEQNPVLSSSFVITENTNFITAQQRRINGRINGRRNDKPKNFYNLLILSKAKVKIVRKN